MNKEKAEEYLKREDEWEEEDVEPITKEEARKRNEEIRRRNEEKVEEVMKEGKIYGDPSAEIQW